jgi:hypothetical protein
LETDFRRPRPNRCDHDRKVNVAGRSSAAPRGKELAPLGVLRFCDLTLWSG